MVGCNKQPRTELDDVERNVIMAMADENLCVSKAANSLYLHRNTVVYHLDQIQMITGLDPRKFYDLVELIDMLMKGEL